MFDFLNIVKTCAAAAVLLVPSALHAQTRTVTGTVTGSSGEPLIGVTVRMNSSSQSGAVTDFDGKYRLTVSKAPARTDSLTFTYVGYEKKAVAWNGQSVTTLPSSTVPSLSCTSITLCPVQATACFS